MRLILLIFSLLLLALLFGDLVQSNEVVIDPSSELKIPKNLKDCNHHQFKQDIPQIGMHLICIRPVEPYSIEISAIKNGHTDIGSIVYGANNGDISNLLEFLQIKMYSVGEKVKPSTDWSVYSMKGREIYTIEDLLSFSTAAIFTNGFFAWPGVRVGYTQTTQDGNVLTTLSLRPLVFKSENFLSHEECDYIKNVSEPFLGPSSTTKKDSQLHEEDSTWRTSSTYFLSAYGHPLIERIDIRVAALTNTMLYQQEQVQVLRYELGQRYDFHTDFFNMDDYKLDLELQTQTQNGRINRYVTVLWYLSDVEEGGHTMFPAAFDHIPEHESTLTGCSDENSLKVAPRKGEVIIFYNQYPSGDLDGSSIHGACPVLKGTKWAANKWIWSGDPFASSRRA